jgi:hypothetical protein
MGNKIDVEEISSLCHIQKQLHLGSLLWAFASLFTDDSLLGNTMNPLCFSIAD